MYIFVARHQQPLQAQDGMRLQVMLEVKLQGQHQVLGYGKQHLDMQLLVKRPQAEKHHYMERKFRREGIDGMKLQKPKEKPLGIVGGQKLQEQIELVI